MKSSNTMKENNGGEGFSRKVHQAFLKRRNLNGDLKNRILRSFLSDDVHFLNQLVRAAGKG